AAHASRRKLASKEKDAPSLAAFELQDPLGGGLVGGERDRYREELGVRSVGHGPNRLSWAFGRLACRARRVPPRQPASPCPLGRLPPAAGSVATVGQQAFRAPRIARRDQPSEADHILFLEYSIGAMRAPFVDPDRELLPAIFDELVADPQRAPRALSRRRKIG